MSGYSGETSCPNCQGEAQLSQDWKPFEYTTIMCYNCGLTINPILKYLSLENLNDERVSNDLEPLNKLPKQDKDVW